jgi:aminopeptidase N
MEYPMICFNGPRPQKDGTYSAGTKYALITVIIHEVGHNYFPMIVNTDERQWTWMDEGINTFLQYLSEQEWEDHYPSQRGEPEDITSYMLSTNQVPIMTNSESVLQFGNNAYGKPATALNILRETILGRELFDFAFKEYARRWKFKRPNPADFFRTMEDASGVDLDWFWAGWFYTTDHVDIALEGVDMFLPDMRSPDEKEATPKTLSEERNEGLSKRANEFPELKDFYNTYDPNAVTDEQRDAHEKFLKELSEEERAILDQNHHFYRLRFRNVGGLVMPIIFRAVFEDGSEKTFHYPAEIWRTDAQQASVFFRTTQPVIRFELDPRRETADANRDNNHFPPEIEPSRFRVFQSRNGEGRIPEGENPMQKARRIEEAKAKEAREKEEKEKATEAEAPKQSGTAEPSATPENPSTEQKERKKPKKKKTPEKIPG